VSIHHSYRWARALRAYSRYFNSFVDLQTPLALFVLLRPCCIIPYYTRPIQNRLYLLYVHAHSFCVIERSARFHQLSTPE